MRASLCLYEVPNTPDKVTLSPLRYPETALTLRYNSNELALSVVLTAWRSMDKLEGFNDIEAFKVSVEEHDVSKKDTANTPSGTLFIVTVPIPCQSHANRV